MTIYGMYCGGGADGECFCKDTKICSYSLSSCDTLQTSQYYITGSCKTLKYLLEPQQ